MASIILTGGGTAGHIIPNIALLSRLKTKFDKIVYIGSENGMEKDLIKNYPFVSYIPITTVKLVRKFTLKNLKIPFLLLKGIKQANKIIKELKPAIIFSKGGFVSVPVVLAGKKNKVPIVSHESDFSLGLANKITKNKVNCICTTFPQTADMLKNGVYVGSPVRDELFKVNKNAVKTKLNIHTIKPILTIIGGSAGSKIFNDIIWKNIDKLLEKFFIIHITGKNKLNKNISKNDYIQIEYTNNIEEIYAITDFAITRGGSNVIWELAALCIPMIIIPLSKKISRGDQIQNALYFEKMGYALTLFEEELNIENLLIKLDKLKAKENIFKSNLKKLDASKGLDKIFNLICNYSNTENCPKPNLKITVTN